MSGFNLTGCPQADVDVAASNVIDIFASIDPTKVLSKVKLHLLTHLQTDIRRFGPLVGCSTEIFESFNAIFRQCSFLSNRQAPSRDIAIQFGKQEGFKHQVTGGWWKTDNGDWVQVRPGIKRFVANNPEILENVGLSSETLDEPGTSHIYLCTLKVQLTVYLHTLRSDQTGYLQEQARSASTTLPTIVGNDKSLTSNQLCFVPPPTNSIAVPNPASDCEVIRSL